MAESDKSNTTQVFHFDLYGKREEKYNFLNQQSIGTIPWTELKGKEPYYFFVEKDFDLVELYEAGFKLDELFIKFSNGITTERDSITLHFDEKSLKAVIHDLIEFEVDNFRTKYNERPDGRDWTILTAKNDLVNNKLNFVKMLYRPFDYRVSCYTGKTKGFYAFPRPEIMDNFLIGSNIGLIVPKQTKETLGGFISKNIAGHKSFSAYDKSTVFLLYFTTDHTSLEFTNSLRTPNLNKVIVGHLSEMLNLKFTNEKEQTPSTFAPIDILDYIYAVLHSPTYREKYKEFLKIDFPRVPYPKDQETFWNLVSFGGELRQIHLLESPKVNQFISTYPMTGNNIITKLRFESSESEQQQQIHKSTHQHIFKLSNFQIFKSIRQSMDQRSAIL